MPTSPEHILIYSKIREHLISADDTVYHANKAFYLAPKENGDIIVDHEVTALSELFSELHVLEKGSRKMTKISLNRPAVMMKLLFDDAEIQFNILLEKFHSTLIVNQRITTANNGWITASAYMSNVAAKDEFLNLATAILLSTVCRLLKSRVEVILMCPPNFQINDVLHNVHLEVTLPSVKYYGHDFNLKELEDSKSVYLSTRARLNKCAVDNAFRVIYGNFTFKDMNNDDAGSLKGYITSRNKELLKQAEERLLDCNEDLSIEQVCHKMLPFIVLFDLFSSSTPFNPLNPSPQQLRDAVFIHYNIARIAHIKQVYEKVEKQTLQTDLSLLNLDIEWALTCQLVNFEQVFKEAFINPLAKVDNQAYLSINKILQYLVKLVKSFSKYYSSTKIVTYDHKETLVVRMNTRMLLVNSVYNVLAFCLKDVFGVPLVFNM